MQVVVILCQSAVQVWFANVSLIFAFITARMLRNEKQDRARFLESPAERHESCSCESCTHPGLRLAWHVAAYMLMAVFLPWQAAIVHVFVLAHT